MELLIGVLLLLIGIWTLVSYFVKTGSSTSTKQAQNPEIKLLEKSTDWQISYQLKQNYRHKSAYKDALSKNDSSRIKVHKAMWVFGKSLLSHFSHEFRNLKK